MRLKHLLLIYVLVTKCNLQPLFQTQKYKQKSKGDFMKFTNHAKILISLILAFTFILNNFAQTKIKLPEGVKYSASVEGITEYWLANGMRVLLYPDQTKQTTTVNVTYLVGSKYENYGETGMAHLLEHMVFKGTPKPTPNFHRWKKMIQNNWCDHTRLNRLGAFRAKSTLAEYFCALAFP